MAMITEKELDDRLNYKDIYLKLLKKAKVDAQGKNVVGLCPYHEDTTPSFSAKIENGTCNCFTCGAKPNFVSFYMHINHMTDKKEAIKQICNEYGIDAKDGKSTKPAKPKKGQYTPYTLEEYAADKHLNADYLANIWGLTTAPDKYQKNRLVIPYCRIDGNLLFNKYRYKGKDFNYDAGNKMDFFYGLQFIEYIKESKSVILVEGESDTQTLNFLGFNALGIPGAQNVKAVMCEPLKDIEDLKIYIHQENDKAGADFVKKTEKALSDIDFKGELYVIKCSDFGEKDPSDLYIKYGNDAKSKIQSLLDNAEKIDLNHIEPTITGAPVNLRIPVGYKVDNSGIYIEDKEGIEHLISSTPFTISKRITSLENNEQKIELFIKNDNRRFTEIFNRKDVFISQNILNALSCKGVNISSDNVKYLIKYMTMLEQNNGDLIPDVEFVTRNGWIGKDRFMPFCNGNVIIDDSCNEDCNGSVFELKGTIKEWVNVIQPYRNNIIFRFILASSFSAPLIRLVKCRSILVYNWANSRGGKTAALKAALSVWGNAEKMMLSFNSTVTALERTANFYNDLPIGIDERQSATSSQKMLETLFFMISNGKSKARSNVKAGLQKVDNWLTVALFTGEQPFVNMDSDNGISSRIFELYGKPFNDEKDASQMHRDISDLAGVAGKQFMENLIKYNRDELLSLNDEYIDYIEKLNLGLDDSHIRMLACVGVADTLASFFVFSETWEKACKESKQMMSQIAIKVINSTPKDKNIRALSCLYDFYMSNRDLYFNPDNRMHENYGFELCNNKRITPLSEFNSYAENQSRQIADKLVIYTNGFNEIISKFGFNPGTVKMYLIENNLVDTQINKKTNTVELKVRSYNNTGTIRPYCIDLVKLRELLYPEQLQEDTPYKPSELDTAQEVYN